jgi:hypothetical protein
MGDVVPYGRELTPDIQERLNALPPGEVGVASHFLGRYREFDGCFNTVWLPPGSVKEYFLGVDPCHHFNEMVRRMRDRKLEWVWILGDDHVFCQDLWLKLWERDVDIVVPMCLRRTDFTPILNHDAAGGFICIGDSWPLVAAKSGLMEWEGTTGNAGMLIRKHVFDKIEEPWFQAGKLSPEFSGSDLYFCYQAQKAGFKVWIDLDNPIGHINHMAIWPRRDEEGAWHIDVRMA